jgi:hypothetical protein
VGTLAGVKLAAVSAIADMVAPVAITSLVLAVVSIAMALVHNSETVGAIALGLVIAGAVMLLGGLVVVALAYAPQRGL